MPTFKEWLNYYLNENTWRVKLVYFLLTFLIVLVWYSTFLFFNDNLGIFDWLKESYFFTFLKQSILEYHTIPSSFIAPDPSITWYPSLATTASFLGNPETMFFSPIMIFLPFVSISMFIKIFLITHVMVGSYGIFKLGKYFNLDLISIIILFSLIILNPWLMQHLAIGYTPWIFFSFFPYIIYALISKYKLSKIITASIMTALMVYGGGLHMYNWLNLAIFFTTIFSILIYRKYRIIYKIGTYFILSLLLALPRLIACAFSFKGYSANISGSFNSLGDLIGILTDLETFLYKLPEGYNIYGAALYDSSLAMGKYFFVIFIMALMTFIYLFFRRQNKNQLKVLYITFLLVITFTILSTFKVWNFITLKIPILKAEKYPYRFLFIAVILFLFATIYSINCFKGKSKYLMILFLLPLLFNFYQRNNYFNNIGSSQGPKYEDYSLKKYYDENITYLAKDEILKPDIVTPKSLKITRINSNQIILPWLQYKYAKDFIFISNNFLKYSGQKDEQGETNGSSAVVIDFKSKENNRFEIIPNDHNFTINSFIFISLYGVCIFLLTWEKINRFLSTTFSLENN